MILNSHHTHEMEIKYLGMLGAALLFLVVSSFLAGWQAYIRGAILMCCLIVEVFVLNDVMLKQGVPPFGWRVGWIVAVSIVGGIVISSLLAIVGNFELAHKEFSFLHNTPQGFPAVFIATMYGLCLHSLYNLRWRIKFRWLFLLSLLVGEILTLCRLVFLMEEIRSEWNTDFAMLNAFYYLSTILPFVLLWLLILFIFDPLWSEKRYRQFHHNLSAAEE